MAHDPRRIDSVDDLAAFMSTVPPDDGSLSTGGTTSNGGTTIFIDLPEHCPDPPGTTPTTVPPVTYPPGVEPPPLTPVQLENRLVRRTPWALPPFLSEHTDDTKWQKNSDGTNFSRHMWRSKDVTKPSTAPNILSVNPPGAIIQMTPEVLATMHNDLIMGKYDQTVLTPWQVIGTFKNTWDGGSNSFPLWGDDLDFPNDGTNFKCIVSTDYYGECDIVIPTWLKAFYETVELTFYLTDMDGNRLPPRMPSPYMAMIGMDYYIDDYYDVNGQYWGGQMKGWTLDYDNSLCKYRKSLRKHNVNVGDYYGEAELLTLTEPLFCQADSQTHPAGEYVYSRWSEAGYQLLPRTAQNLYNTMFSTSTPLLANQMFTDGVTLTPKKCLNNFEQLSFKFKKLERWGIINIVDIKFYDLIV